MSTRRPSSAAQTARTTLQQDTATLNNLGIAFRAIVNQLNPGASKAFLSCNKVETGRVQEYQPVGGAPEPPSGLPKVNWISSSIGVNHDLRGKLPEGFEPYIQWFGIFFGKRIFECFGREERLVTLDLEVPNSADEDEKHEIVKVWTDSFKFYLTWERVPMAKQGDDSTINSRDGTFSPPPTNDSSAFQSRVDGTTGASNATGTYTQ